MSHKLKPRIELRLDAGNRVCKAIFAEGVLDSVVVASTSEMIILLMFGLKALFAFSKKPPRYSEYCPWGRRLPDGIGESGVIYLAELMRRRKGISELRF